MELQSFPLPDGRQFVYAEAESIAEVEFILETFVNAFGEED